MKKPSNTTSLHLPIALLAPALAACRRAARASSAAFTGLGFGFGPHSGGFGLGGSYGWGSDEDWTWRPSSGYGWLGGGFCQLELARVPAVAPRPTRP